MELIAQGSHAAFNELFRRYAAMILGYCGRLLGQRSLAEDISQEVWVRVVKNADSYIESTPLKAWLLTIARNLSLSYLRKNKLLILTEDISQFDEQFDPLISRLSFEEFVEAQEQTDWLKRAIDTLPATQRTALVVWLSEDYSYERLAQELKTSVSAVKSLLHRARLNIEEYKKSNPLRSTS